MSARSKAKDNFFMISNYYELTSVFPVRSYETVHFIFVGRKGQCADYSEEGLFVHDAGIHNLHDLHSLVVEGVELRQAQALGGCEVRRGYGGFNHRHPVRIERFALYLIIKGIEQLRTHDSPVIRFIAHVAIAWIVLFPLAGKIRIEIRVAFHKNIFDFHAIEIYPFVKQLSPFPYSFARTGVAGGEDLYGVVASFQVGDKAGCGRHAHLVSSEVNEYGRFSSVDAYPVQRLRFQRDGS